MRMTIASVDHAPGELYAQAPLVVDLLRPMNGAKGRFVAIGTCDIAE